MGFRISESELEEFIRKGLVVPRSVRPVCNSKPKRIQKKQVLVNCHKPPSTWLIGVATYSITNSRDIKASIARKGHQRNAVALSLGRCHRSLVKFADDGVHKGKPIRVLMVRIGPGLLDDDNLRGALKYVRDGIAASLGVEDNDPLVRWDYGQEKNNFYGVRVEMSVI